MKNLLDEAVLNHGDLEARLKAKEKYKKIDEIPFDFVRRRMSVVVEDDAGLNTLICKGAVDEVLSLMHPGRSRRRESSMCSLNIDAATPTDGERPERRGFRVIALAYKQMPGAPDEPVYTVKDESDLILLGFLAFLDPPKDTCAAAH